MNDIILGDCLVVMKDMQNDSIDLIYADPPFYSGKDYAAKKGEFVDKWKTLQEYLDFMKARLTIMHDILKTDGTIYLHCDWHASHYLKIIMDDIFGYNQFRNEIVWWYHRWTAGDRNFQRMHDTIFRYTKSNDFCFNTQYRPHGEWVKKDYGHVDEDGRRWRHSGGTGNKGRKVYFDPETTKGVSMDDVWEINTVGSTAKERVGYPTQKPETLLTRIIRSSSDAGDVVLDPFCGSGTTCKSAKALERSYIGIDVSEDACSTARDRCSAVQKTLS